MIKNIAVMCLMSLVCCVQAAKTTLYFSDKTPDNIRITVQSIDSISREMVVPKLRAANFLGGLGGIGFNSLPKDVIYTCADGSQAFTYSISLASVYQNFDPTIHLAGMVRRNATSQVKALIRFNDGLRGCHSVKASIFSGQEIVVDNTQGTIANVFDTTGYRLDCKPKFVTDLAVLSKMLVAGGQSVPSSLLSMIGTFLHGKDMPDSRRNNKEVLQKRAEDLAAWPVTTSFD